MTRGQNRARLAAVAIVLLISGSFLALGLTTGTSTVVQSQTTTTAPTNFFTWFLCFFFRIGCPGSTTTTRPGTTTTTAKPLPVGPAGDAFYVPPSPLPAGRAGDVIWQSSTPSGHWGSSAWKVLYRSTSATGQPIVVSGALLIPDAAWTGGGPRPLVSVAPGTRGLGDSCAPSKGLSGLDALLNKGWAVVQTDYEGLGTPGDHTYMVGPSQGHAVLDAARAALQLKPGGLTAQSPIVLNGYSQGGAGAVSAGEEKATYAPELNVKGVAAGGVPADLNAVSANLEGTFFFGLLAMASSGFDAAYPEVNLESYLTPQANTDLVRYRTQCMIDITLGLANKKMADLLINPASNPLTQPQIQARIADSYLGNVAPALPHYLYHGVTDQIIPFAVGTGLRDRYCAKGVTVQWKEYPGVDHIAGATVTDYVNWIDQRFKGVAATSTC